MTDASSAALVASAQQHLVPTYRQRALVLDRGQGSRLWDSEGREYVDFAAGIAVSALGHGDPDILAALHEQADKLWHTSNIFLSEPPLRLAEELVAASGFASRVFFCNSGAEANEAAIKLVRRHAANAGRAPQQRTIISFKGSFHGRTLATVTATAQPKYQQGFEPLPGGFRYAPFNDVAAFDALFDTDVAAVLVEPVQGEGGVVPAAPGFLAHLRARCDEVGALLVFDEIQTGVGRSGKLWAHQWDGVVPDVMTLAKGLGCGFPIGAMLVAEHAAQTLEFGSHGTTFGGNPLAAAVARVALRKLAAPGLLANVETQSRALREGLRALDEKHQVFTDVRGRGLMLGAVLRAEFSGRAAEILDHAANAGLLLLQAGPDVLRFVPALNIGADDVAEGLARLDAALTTWRA
ncbi:aspartate aminotransferase family protein [Denitratimonas sp. CY0512]|uniref:aspartate aminotransferase family protein n=1 Tax=Denitratimonas sp. CY0512 TaxID=3131940 RepID=UPI00309EC721